MKSKIKTLFAGKVIRHLKNNLKPVLFPLRGHILSAISCRKITKRMQFERLAQRNDIPGMKDIWVCKFLITNVDGPGPKLFFMNTKKCPHHFKFFRKVTGQDIPETDFDSVTYYSNIGKKNLASSIVAHDNYSDSENQHGIYSIEYWPTDPVSHAYIQLSWNLITKAMPFADERICYHLSSQTQINQFESEKELYNNSAIKLIHTDVLFNKLSFIPLNLGDSYGILKIMDNGEIPAFNDIVIFRSLPNDLSHVRGIITDVSQTPLSHVNLKAKQNSIPNAHIKNASTKEEFVRLVDKPVRFIVTPDGYEIIEVSPQALNDHLEKVAPVSTCVPPMNFDFKEIVNLKDISKESSVAFGAKAGNMGEVHSILSEKYVIDGNAIPFYLYDNFMRENDFYSVIEELIRDEQFNRDIQCKSQRLSEFRQLIHEGEVADWMRKMFQDMQSQYSKEADLRLRSSSNSEDLENFNGAGLYSSMVHFAQDGPIENTIKKVWASLWTYRAFTEREFHKIDHTRIAMGILVHLDRKNEQHNGVAVTKNLFDSIWDGFYINVQWGQSLVTNPDAEALPDELVVSAVGANQEYEIQYIRRSNLVPQGQSVMQESQVFDLVEQCRIIHDHFKKCYYAEGDESFAMEIEFLTTSDGVLKIMQARPWLD